MNQLRIQALYRSLSARAWRHLSEPPKPARQVARGLLGGLTMVTVVVLIFSNGVASAAIPSAGTTFDGQQMPTLAPMVDRVAPGVVNIRSSGSVEVRNPFANDPFFRRFFDVPDQPSTRQTQSLGSGVVVDAANGYILTNHHVIQDMDEIEVTLHDGRELTAVVVGSDQPTDVAVLKVDADDLHQLPLSDSENVRVGDFVIAIGNPFGIGQTITSGIISGLGRRLDNGTSYQLQDFIQTDASINPGNSGGALLNLRGELVGINTAIISRTGVNIGLGFAIPTNIARSVMDQIIEHGAVHRGLLGVSIVDVDDGFAELYDVDTNGGAVVREITPGSAADDAGIQVFDVITAVDGEPVEDATDLRTTIGLKRAGQGIRIDYLRNGSKRDTTATLGEREVTAVASTESPGDSPSGSNLHPNLAGAEFTEIPQGAPGYGEVDGVFVNRVQQQSPAWRFGLQQGDIITEVDRRPVTDLNEFREAATEGEAHWLKVDRGGQTVAIRIP